LYWKANRKNEPSFNNTIYETVWKLMEHPKVDEKFQTATGVYKKEWKRYGEEF